MFSQSTYRSGPALAKRSSAAPGRDGVSLGGNYASYAGTPRQGSLRLRM
jgi:hypothetical protein